MSRLARVMFREPAAFPPAPWLRPPAATPQRVPDPTWDRVLFRPPGLDKSHLIFDPPPYRSRFVSAPSCGRKGSRIAGA